MPRCAAAALAVLLVLTTPRLARADDDPSTGRLLLAGAGMAVPTYLLGVVWHEGTHAAMARLFGAELLEVRLYPSVYQGRFYFGLTRWRGEMSCGEKALTLVAPKLTDLVLLGGYSLLVGLDALPENDYGALAFTVLATGAWLDFSKDLFSTRPSNDLVKVHLLYGRHTEWQRLPWRLLHAGLTAASAYVLVRGYQDVFRDEPATAPLLFQLWGGRF